jgi:DNA-binding transcriptional LysR family regulator
VQAVRRRIGTRHQRHRRLHREGIDSAPAIPDLQQQILDQQLHEAVYVCCSPGRLVSRLIASVQSIPVVHPCSHRLLVQRFYAEPLCLVSEKDECMICCRRWANVMSFICLFLIVHTAPTTTAQLTRNTGIIWISINIRQAMSEEKNKEIRICWLKGKE